MFSHSIQGTALVYNWAAVTKIPTVVTPPSVHQMVLTLETNGFIERVPGKARSIRLLIAPEDLPTSIYSNLGRCSGRTRRRMDRACPGVLSMRLLRSRVLIIS